MRRTHEMLERLHASFFRQLRVLLVLLPRMVVQKPTSRWAMVLLACVGVLLSGLIPPCRGLHSYPSCQLF